MGLESSAPETGSPTSSHQARANAQVANPTNELVVDPQPESQNGSTVDSMVVITFADEASSACFG